MDDFLKKIFFLSLSMVLLSAVSCSNDTVNKRSDKEMLTFFNDFEKDSNSYIWKNMKRIESDSAFSGNFVCECTEDMLYAFGFDLPVHDSIGQRNALFSFDMMLKAEYKPQAIFAFSIQKGDEVVLWNHFLLSDGFEKENQWYRNTFEMLVPNDVLRNTSLNCYIMNNNKENILIDDFGFSVEYVNMPTYVDDVQCLAHSNDFSEMTDSETLNLLYSDKDKMLALADNEIRR